MYTDQHIIIISTKWIDLMSDQLVYYINYNIRIYSLFLCNMLMITYIEAFISRSTHSNFY